MIKKTNTFANCWVKKKRKNGRETKIGVKFIFSTSRTLSRDLVFRAQTVFGKPESTTNEHGRRCASSPTIFYQNSVNNSFFFLYLFIFIKESEKLPYKPYCWKLYHTKYESNQFFKIINNNIKIVFNYNLVITYNIIILTINQKQFIVKSRYNLIVLTKKQLLFEKNCIIFKFYQNFS